jgi:N-dimethylarginine dimethylaminohydrolase
VPDTRVRRRRRFLVCEPRHFAVQYAINPWMHPDAQVDVDLAQEQWQTLIGAYRSHGHTVDTVPPVAGLPDMVFAANSAVVVDGRVFGSSSTRPSGAPSPSTTTRGSRRRATTSTAPSR